MWNLNYQTTIDNKDNKHLCQENKTTASNLFKGLFLIKKNK
jgi:hypothetical protein